MRTIRLQTRAAHHVQTQRLQAVQKRVCVEARSAFSGALIEIHSPALW
jgi:hypothetical protein